MILLLIKPGENALVITRKKKKYFFSATVYRNLKYQNQE